MQASYSSPADLEPLVPLLEKGAIAADELAAKFPRQAHHAENAAHCRRHSQQLQWLIEQEPDDNTAMRALACLIAGKDIPGAPAAQPASASQLLPGQALDLLHEKIDQVLANQAADSNDWPEDLEHALKLFRYYGLDRLKNTWADMLLDDFFTRHGKVGEDYELTEKDKARIAYQPSQAKKKGKK